jgi:hypothetical protein
VAAKVWNKRASLHLQGRAKMEGAGSFKMLLSVYKITF